MITLPAAAREIVPALQRLCSMKSQAQFTGHKLETWQAALSVFPVEDVNLAVLTLGLSADPFPDLGKLMLKCEALRRHRAGNAPQAGVVALSTTVLQRVAAAMGLRIPADT